MLLVFSLPFFPSRVDSFLSSLLSPSHFICPPFSCLFLSHGCAGVPDCVFATFNWSSLFLRQRCRPLLFVFSAFLFPFLSVFVFLSLFLFSFVPPPIPCLFSSPRCAGVPDSVYTTFNCSHSVVLPGQSVRCTITFFDSSNNVTYALVSDLSVNVQCPFSCVNYPYFSTISSGLVWSDSTSGSYFHSVFFDYAPPSASAFSGQTFVFQLYMLMDVETIISFNAEPSFKTS